MLVLIRSMSARSRCSAGPAPRLIVLADPTYTALRHPISGGNLRAATTSSARKAGAFDASAKLDPLASHIGCESLCASSLPGAGAKGCDGGRCAAAGPRE